MSKREARYFNSARRVRQDYSKKNLANPFHKNRVGYSQARTTSKRFKLSCILLLLFLAGLIWLLFLSNVFLIKHVEVTGLTRTSEEEIKNLVAEQENRHCLLVFPESNLWSFRKDKLISNLQEKYNFAGLKVKKRLLHTLKIEVQEREYAFVYAENNKYYYLDNESYIIGEIPLLIQTATPLIISTSTATTTASTTLATTTALFDIPKAFNELKKVVVDKYLIIMNNGDDQVADDRVNLNKDYFTFARQISDQLTANKDLGLAIDYFLLTEELSTLTVKLNSGLIIKFSLKEDWQNQINNLFTLKKELKNDFYKVIKQKIDLRYGDRVYYE